MSSDRRARRVAVLVATLCATSAAGCSRAKEPAPGAAPPPPAAKQPVRVAAEDSDLRVLLAEVASAKACTMMRGQFRPLRDPKRPTVVTGVLWIHGCQITNQGTKLTYRMSGTGWQWADERMSKAGATFAVRDYVRFGVEMIVPGALDTAYDRGSHVVSLWFTPSQTPDVRFTALGKIDVDEEGAWSSVVGALASAFSSSPDERAQDEAEGKGSAEMKKQFAEGLSVTIALCTGLTRFGLGRPRQGKMVPAEAGETHQIPVELQPGGLLIFGPLPAKDGLTADIHVRSGGVRVEMMCAEQAEILTRAYAAGSELPAVRPLAARDARDSATLRLGGASCPVAVVTRPLANAAATFDWKRPLRESAQATGGPLIDCGAER